MKTLDEASKKYADKEFPNANDIDAPFTTTGDLYEIARESFVLGANWQASQGWVSCKDRLPEPDEINGRYSKTVPTYWNGNELFCYYCFDKKMWQSVEHFDFVKVDYWYEIPQPPKQD